MRQFQTSEIRQVVDGVAVPVANGLGNHGNNEDSYRNHRIIICYYIYGRSIKMLNAVGWVSERWQMDNISSVYLKLERVC